MQRVWGLETSFALAFIRCNLPKDDPVPQTVKIATCSYCGTRAALVLNKVRHELVCSACGAPLHEMKSMPLAAAKRADPSGPVRGTAKQPERGRVRYASKPKRPKKNKKRRGFQHKLWEELWDVVEDIFD